jgi:hypothetical protein
MSHQRVKPDLGFISKRMNTDNVDRVDVSLLTVIESKVGYTPTHQRLKGSMKSCDAIMLSNVLNLNIGLADSSKVRTVGLL